MYRRYYKTLGLEPGAGPEEIRKAFRREARKLHPDINPAPDARERFIEAYEAYEFLRSLSKGGAETAREKNHSYREWTEKQRTEARRQAAENARKKYEEFKKSKAYRTTETLNKSYNYLTLLLGIIIILGSIYGFTIRTILAETPGDKPSVAVFIASVFTGIIFTFVSVINIKVTKLNQKKQ